MQINNFRGDLTDISAKIKLQLVIDDKRHVIRDSEPRTCHLEPVKVLSPHSCAPDVVHDDLREPEVTVEAAECVRPLCEVVVSRVNDDVGHENSSSRRVCYYVSASFNHPRELDVAGVWELVELRNFERVRYRVGAVTLQQPNSHVR